MKTKHMFPLLLSLLFSAALSSVNAQVTFTDDFNRADASDLGSNYTYYNNFASSSSIYGISSNTAISTTASAQNALALVVESAFVLQDGDQFTMELDLQSDTTDSNWAGFVYNFQDASNFSYVRWKPSTGAVQAITLVDEVISSYATITDTDYLTTATVHLLLTGDGSGNYTVTLSRSGVDDASLDWSSTIFTDGQAGLYYTGAGTGASEWTFDNFSANIPEQRSSAILLGIGTITAVLFMRRRK